jgi:hypothetical protein
MHMGSIQVRLLGLLTIGIICSLIACSGGGGGSAPASATVPLSSSPVIIGLAVNPSSTAITAGDSVSLTVTVSGTSNTAVTWSVDGIPNGNAGVGTISATGDAVTYTAPGSTGSHVVTVTSLVDSTKSATSTVVVNPPSEIISVTLSPEVATLATGASQSFNATVSNSANTDVIWTIDGSAAGNATVGTLVGNGLGITYTAPSAPGDHLLVATSAADPTKSATSTVTVVVPNSVTSVAVSPATLSLNTGATNQFSATVAGTGSYSSAVTWTAQKGTISSAGLYTAPTTSGSDVVTATSVQNLSKLATATVSVLAVAPTTPVITALSQVNAQSTNNIASIPAQAGCSYTWTLTGGTITAGQGTTSLTFTAGAAGTMLLGCTVTNSASVSVSAQQSITVLGAVQTASYYGSGMNVDDLGNQVIGWNSVVDTCNRKASIRVRALYSSTLVSIRPKFIWSDVKGGYGLGTGGDIVIQIQTDDGSSNHLPSGTVLASLEYDQPITIGNYFPLLTFSNPANLTAGQLYHIVFSNVDADPSANYVSLDHEFMWNVQNPEQPAYPNTDLCPLETSTSGAWVKFVRGSTNSYTPTIELDYGNGASQGQGYIQGFGQTCTTSTSGWVNPKPISGTQGVRETFTVSGASRTVSSVAVRVNRVSGSSPLTITVEKSDGTLVGQGSVVVGQGVVDGTSAGETWATVTFGSPLTLQAGVGYLLVLSSPTDTVHTTHAIEKGNVYGFSASTYFADGYAQFNSGSGWVGWDLFAVPNRTDCDLQFYFQTQ